MPVTHVHILEKSGLEDSARLSRLVGDGLTLTEGPEVPAGTQILVGGRPSREQLASPDLTTLIIPWVGLPIKTSGLLNDFPHLQVHNLHHNAPMVAEIAIALLLAAAKFVVPLDQALRNNDWAPRFEPARSVLLSGKACLILGYGAIGKRVARVCRSLDMTVLATRREAQEPDGVAHEIHPPSALSALLPRAHALVICLPLTAETAGMIGTDELALLPREAVLVNIGRGPIVDEEALFTALSKGTIAGAGLDVWYNYPTSDDPASPTPPANFPFGELDNVVLSPHRGGSVAETDELRTQALAEMLLTAAAGKPLPNRVDVARGY